MKKIIFILMIIIVPVLIFGYSTRLDTVATEQQDTQFIKVQTLSYSDGSVLQGFYISVDSQFLSNKGANLQEISNFKKSLASSLDSYKTYLLAYYSSIYLANPNENFIIGSGGGLEFTQTGELENEIIGFQIKFTSRDAWNYYHPSSGSQETDNNSDDKEFISKIESNGELIFSQNISAGITYAQYFINMYLNAGNELTLSTNLQDIYSPNLVYEYAISSSKIHSNANYTYLSQLGLYHHIWERNIENYQTDNQMSLYYFKPNTQWWYLAIICVAVAIVLIGYIVVLISKKVKKKI